MWKFVWRNSGSRRVSRGRRGLTLTEVVVSTMIVGMMTVAALNGLGSTTRSSELAGNRGIALGLADSLLAEILATAYHDPNTAPSFGLEPGEAAPRANFDDVDDFNGWSQMPPTAADGTTIPDRADFRQRITVDRVLPADPTQTTPGTDLGVKRIRVTIECEGVVLADHTAIVTNTEK